MNRRFYGFSAGSVQVQCRLKSYLHCKKSSIYKGLHAISAGSAGSVFCKPIAHARTRTRTRTHAQGEYRRNLINLHCQGETPTTTRVSNSAGLPGTCTEPALNLH